MIWRVSYKVDGPSQILRQYRLMHWIDSSRIVDMNIELIFTTARGYVLWSKEVPGQYISRSEGEYMLSEPDKWYMEQLL